MISRVKKRQPNAEQPTAGTKCTEQEKGSWLYAAFYIGSETKWGERYDIWLAWFCLFTPHSHHIAVVRRHPHFLGPGPPVSWVYEAVAVAMLLLLVTRSCAFTRETQQQLWKPGQSSCFNFLIRCYASFSLLPCAAFISPCKQCSLCFQFPHVLLPSIQSYPVSTYSVLHTKVIQLSPSKPFSLLSTFFLLPWNGGCASFEYLLQIPNSFWQTLSYWFFGAHSHRSFGYSLLALSPAHSGKSPSWRLSLIRFLAQFQTVFQGTLVFFTSFSGSFSLKRSVMTDFAERQYAWHYSSSLGKQRNHKRILHMLQDTFISFLS